jgi:uncharacterized membrane protein YciS (DUF1049 family)
VILTLACIGSFCLGWVLCGLFGRESRLEREAELARAKELTRAAQRGG